MLPEISAHDFATALDRCVESLLWEAGMTAPPVDALAVAAELGIVVTQDVALPERARFVRLAEQAGNGGGQATIVVAPAERPEREQWAVAHEIGESVAYRVFDALDVDVETAPPAAREIVANRLAIGLLLPRAWFAADGAALDWDLLALKQRNATASHELIARRMLEMDSPLVITLFDLGRVIWRRSNAGSRRANIVPEELAVWREAHERGCPSGAALDPCTTGLESVRCWPVHEPGWKREILRSAIAEWCNE